MRCPSRLLSLLAAPCLLVGMAGISTGSSQAAAPLVKLGSGKLLLSAKGVAQYVFAVDKKGVSACYGQCATYWPPTLVPSGTMVPKTMKGIPGTFGTTMRKDGAEQLTYDGAPLYSFSKDKDSGDLYGEGIGGVWWAVIVSAIDS